MPAKKSKRLGRMFSTSSVSVAAPTESTSGELGLFPPQANCRKFYTPPRFVASIVGDRETFVTVKLDTIEFSCSFQCNLIEPSVDTIFFNRPCYRYDPKKPNRTTPTRIVGDLDVDRVSFRHPGNGKSAFATFFQKNLSRAATRNIAFFTMASPARDLLSLVW